MIVVRLSDGLGNQLFQYAASQVLRERERARIGFLTDAFLSPNARRDRPLLLTSVVECAADVLRPDSARFHFNRALHRLCRPKSRGRTRHVPRLCHVSGNPGCDGGFDRVRDGMLMAGYFQSASCVGPVLPAVTGAIRRKLSDRIDRARAGLRARFGARRLVALHLRLGDYRTIGDGREAIVPIERVRTVMGEVGSDCQIVLFTDSPDAVGEMDLGRPPFPYLGGHAIDDFAAMIACDDFIIANSTFSWWASAAGGTPGKRIWAPADWSRPARPGSDPRNPIYSAEHLLY